MPKQLLILSDKFGFVTTNYIYVDCRLAMFTPPVHLSTCPQEFVYLQIPPSSPIGLANEAAKGAVDPWNHSFRA